MPDTGGGAEQQEALSSRVRQLATGASDNLMRLNRTMMAIGDSTLSTLQKQKAYNQALENFEERGKLFDRVSDNMFRMVTGASKTEVAYKNMKQQVDDANLSTNRHAQLMNKVDKAYKRARNGPRTFKEELKDLTGTAEAAGQKMIDAIQGFAGTFSSKLTDMLWEAEGTFADIAKSFGKMMTKMAIQLAAKQTINAFLGGLMCCGSSTTQQQAMSRFQAQGGVWQDGVQTFAQGGVVSEPTMFPMAQGAGLMGEAGAEAIMPLERMSSGDLGVKTSFDDSEKGGVNINNNIVNNSSAEVSSDAQVQPDGTIDIETRIDEAVSKSISKGRGRKAVQDTFGVKPQGTQRS